MKHKLTLMKVEGSIAKCPVCDTAAHCFNSKYMYCDGEETIGSRKGPDKIEAYLANKEKILKNMKW